MIKFDYALYVLKCKHRMLYTSLKMASDELEQDMLVRCEDLSQAIRALELACEPKVKKVAIDWLIGFLREMPVYDTPDRVKYTKRKLAELGIVFVGYDGDVEEL